MFDARGRERKPGDVRALLIVKTGSTMPDLQARRGDYEDWIVEGLGGDVGPVEICHVAGGEALPDPAEPRAVVVTGSSALVTDRAAWSERTGRWMVEVVRRGTPTLAICYGHQLLADALGGEVGPNVNGREMGAIDVELTDEGRAEPIFEGLPEMLRVSSSHRECVRRLPPGARRLATNGSELNQAYAVGERTWAVQFHPEWDHEVIRAYVEARVEILRGEGFDPDALLERIGPSSHGNSILAAFGQLAR